MTPCWRSTRSRTVLRSVVDYQGQTQAALAGVDPATLSDREVVDDLLKNALLLEEAEARGLTPTQGGNRAVSSGDGVHRL